MLERTQVFVDTSYLLASFYNSWETGARAQLEIVLPEVVGSLVRMIEQQLKQPVQRQMWYDGIPDSGPHRYQRALRTCDGVQLRAGQLIEWGERRTQKAVDTRLVADLVLAGVRQQCSDIVLVSGDADMIPGVQEAVNAGIRVHLYGFGWDSMSSQLRHCCDSTTILDPREDFADCMQLHVLEGPRSPAPQNETEDTPDGDSAEDAPKFDEDINQTEEFTDQPPTNLVDQEISTEPTGQPEQFSEQSSEATFFAEDSMEISEVDTDDLEEDSYVEEQMRRSEPVAPNPSMMAPRRKLRSRYVPLPKEVWSTAGVQTPYDVGQQYASWWFENAASAQQRDQAHMLSGGGLPPEIDRPLLQFACETLHEYTLSESQRVSLRDGFHSGIRGVLTKQGDES